MSCVDTHGGAVQSRVLVERTGMICGGGAEHLLPSSCPPLYALASPFPKHRAVLKTARQEGAGLVFWGVERLPTDFVGSQPAEKCGECQAGCLAELCTLGSDDVQKRG